MLLDWQGALNTAKERIMRTALTHANLLTPEGFKDGQTVLIENGCIVDICDDADCPDNVVIRHDINGMRLLPGLIDLQVNGGGGVLFNDDPSVETIKAIGAAHRKFGTTGFLPTLISDDLDIMATAIETVDKAIEQGVPGVLGIHLEGPFLNEGRKGVHDASKFSSIGDAEIDLLSSLKHGKTLVTLAPEMTTPDVIRTLAQRGIIVAAGHTQASYEQTLSAMDAGLTGFTHLFNAMKPLESRQPGVIAAALEDERAWCGIIADGHHVHPAMLRMALRAKHDNQIFLVTDAMPSVGAAHKPFSLGALKISVADGKCVTDAGTLAGSDLDIISAVRNAHDLLGLPLAQAVKMASQVPARFIGLDQKLGSISIGQQADFIVIDKNFQVTESWIKGDVQAFA